MKNYYSRLLFVLLICSYSVKTSAQNHLNGEWSEVIPFGIVPVAVANLPDGNLITWSAQSKINFNKENGATYYEVFDPFSGPNGTALGEQQSTTNHNMFCPGINNLDDGRILIAGGSSSEKTTIYDYKTGEWISAMDMHVPRGYQSNVTLSNGTVFTIGGSWSGGRVNKLGEIWSPKFGWRELPGVTGDITYNDNDSELEPEGIFRLDNHTWLWPAPNGKVFHAGPGEDMHWIDTEGIGNVTYVGKRANDTYSMKGTTVMFDVGKLLKVGGSTSYASKSEAKDNSFVIDINDEDNVTVTPTENNLSFSRTMHNSTVLPNGEVLITGGLSSAIVFSDEGARFTAEMYNPETNTWRNVADMNEARTYHSVSILMTDGRVFAGGGGLCGNCAGNHLNAEIYSPPYLFNEDGSLANRPIINAEKEAAYNSPLVVTSEANIQDFVFIRMSSATHSINNEQRRIPLTFQNNNDNTFTLNIPGSNLLPPGFYMLFAIDTAGIPSVAEVVKVGENEVIVEEINFPSGNIAYKRPTTQSSSVRGGGSSARAVDGITNGIYNQHSVTHTKNDDNSWWRVDLGYEYDLNEIKIFNRTDCCINRLNSAKLYVGNIDSSNPEDYQEVAGLNNNPEQSFSENLGSGRYVMVRLESKNYLSLAEVQVFGTLTNASENIALNKKTSQSSNWRRRGRSSKAVDGNTNGNWSSKTVTHTKKDTNSWWRVDLGDTYNVEKINVYNRTDCCNQRLSTGEIFLGNVNSTNPDHFLKIGTLGQEESFSFETINIEGQYVMIRLTGTNFLSLAEVEVYGSQKPDIQEEVRSKITSNYKKEVLSNLETEIGNVKLYPNPSKGIFSINLTSEKIRGKLRISIFNASGQSLFMKNYGQDYVAIEDIDVSHFPNGLYIVSIASEGELITKQLIVKK